MDPIIEIKAKETLSANWYKLYKYSFTKQSGSSIQTQHREVYDRGNGAVILLYNTEKKTVVLTRQFRMPTFVNGNPSGMLIEACAGLLDNDHPKEAIMRETEEETGYRLTDVKKVYECYMSPGSVTEILHFFIGSYADNQKVTDGGGLAEEQEEIEVLEIPFVTALKMIETGEIKDGKTIMLLQYLQIHIFKNG